MATTEKPQKIAKEFVCEKCDYKCCNKFDYNKHLTTRKHLKTNVTIEKSQEVAYSCANCNSTYKHKPSLYKHKRTCTVIPATSAANELLNLCKDFITKSETIQRETIEVNKQILELYKIRILPMNPDANIN